MMTVPAPFLKNLLDYASYQNMDASALRKFTANPDIDFSNPEEMVDARHYLLVFQRIIESINSDYSGLSMGAYLNLSSLGLVVEISLNTSSLKQGIYFLKNFLKNKFPIVSLTIAEDSECYALQLESPVENKEVKKQLLNMVLCIVYRELKLMLPNNLAPQLRLPFSEKEQVSLFFKGDISNSHTHQLLLPKNLDELEINVNRVKEIELLLPKFISMLYQNGKNTNAFSRSVKGMTLNMCNPEIPNLKQVQRQFACSERTFQRKLTAEGTSFRRIVNEIKKDLSFHLANEKHLKTKDIAYILGYSESSAYLHALKGWQTELGLKSVSGLIK